MPAQSKAQQRLFGMALALRRGELEPDEVGKKVKEIADSDITTKDIKKFAKTKCKKLPKHVTKEGITYNVTAQQLVEMIQGGTRNFLIKEGFIDDEFEEFESGVNEELEALITQFEPEAIKYEGDSTSGYGVQLKDRHSDFTVWMDIYVRNNDIQADWTEYIFHTNNSNDMLLKGFQEDTDMFEVCESEAVYFLEKNGLLFQDDNGNWSYKRPVDPDEM